MKRPSLTAWILIGMVAGVAFGASLLPAFAKQLGLLSTIFLRLIHSIIAPLIFATLVYGIAGTGSVKNMGRIGGKAILYFEIVTTLALFLGLAAVNLVRPGAGVALARTAADAAVPQTPDDGRGIRRTHRSHQHHRCDGPRRRAPDRRVSRSCSAQRARPSARRRRRWSRSASRWPR